MKQLEVTEQGQLHDAMQWCELFEDRDVYLLLFCWMKYFIVIKLEERWLAISFQNIYLQNIGLHYTIWPNIITLFCVLLVWGRFSGQFKDSILYIDILENSVLQTVSCVTTPPAQWNYYFTKEHSTLRAPPNCHHISHQSLLSVCKVIMHLLKTQNSVTPWRKAAVGHCTTYVERENQWWGDDGRKKEKKKRVWAQVVCYA